MGWSGNEDDYAADGSLKRSSKIEQRNGIEPFLSGQSGKC